MKYYAYSSYKLSWLLQHGEYTLKSKFCSRHRRLDAHCSFCFVSEKLALIIVERHIPAILERSNSFDFPFQQHVLMTALAMGRKLLTVYSCIVMLRKLLWPLVNEAAWEDKFKS